MQIVFSRYPGRIAVVFFVLMVAWSCSSSRKTTDTNNELPANSIQKKYAGLLKVPPKSITNAALYNFIDKWMKTSYSYGGQSSKGIDCSGFTQKLYEAVYKKKLPRTSEAQYKATHTVNSRKKLEEGDLVFFTTLKGKKISHVGVYLQNNRFVNATNQGVDISDMNAQYWNDRFVAGGKVE